MEKKCENCKYSVRHYVILQNAHFGAMDCGHCVKRRTNANLKRTSDIACEFWQSNEENRKRLEHAIDYRIAEFAKQLYHIVQIKKAD